MTCANPPCCGGNHPWPPTPDDCNYQWNDLLNIEVWLINGAVPFAYDPDEEWPFSGSPHCYKIDIAWECNESEFVWPSLPPSKLFFARGGCGNWMGMRRNGCDPGFNYFDSTYSGSVLLRKGTDSHWYVLINQQYLYDLGADLPDLWDIDLSLATYLGRTGFFPASYYAWNPTSISITALADCTDLGPNIVGCCQHYYNGLAQIMGVDVTTDSPPWSDGCCLRGTITIDYTGTECGPYATDLEIEFLLHPMPGYWDIGYVLFSGWDADGYPISLRAVNMTGECDGWYWWLMYARALVDIDNLESMCAYSAIADIQGDDPVGLTFTCESDWSYQFDCQRTTTATIDAWESCDYILPPPLPNCDCEIGINTCMEITLGGKCGCPESRLVYLSKSELDCTFASGTILIDEEEVEVIATLDEDCLLTIEATILGKDYIWTKQLVSGTNYLGQGITLSNTTGGNCYKTITLRFIDGENCTSNNTIAPEDCPLCKPGSGKVKCIVGVANGVDPADSKTFFMSRVSSCTWTGIAYYCDGSNNWYTATLTASIDGCVVTFELTITTTENAEYVKYCRTYHIDNASTDCHGSYLLQECDRDGMAEFGDSFHILYGTDEECPDTTVENPYPWDDAVVVRLDAEPPYWTEMALDMISSSATQAMYQWSGQIYCPDQGQNYDATVTLTITWDCYCTPPGDCLSFLLQVQSDAPLGCNFGLGGVVRMDPQDYFCNKIDAVIGQWTIYAPIGSWIGCP